MRYQYKNYLSECPICGQELKNDTMECPACGANLVGFNEAENNSYNYQRMNNQLIKETDNINQQKKDLNRMRMNLAWKKAKQAAIKTILWVIIIDVIAVMCVLYLWYK